MTAYHGGKQKIGAKITDVIADMTEEVKYHGYCEPFCGMLGVYQHIPAVLDDGIDFLAGDANESVVKMWSAAQKGWRPPTKNVSEPTFKQLAKSQTSSAEKGFIGHHYGYMGRYFKPYKTKTSDATNKVVNKIVKIAKKLNKVKFTAGEYTQFSKLKGYIIYCDPPYDVGSHYYEEGDNIKHFDNDTFLKWCKKMSKNNYVFMSEYKAPSDFQLVWEDPKGKERLYYA